MRLLLTLGFWLCLTLQLAAQTLSVDYESWERTAQRAEEVVAAARASSEALEVLRNDVADWRAEFLAAQSTNATRIETVRGQIIALGPVPEAGDEDAELAARRTALDEQLARLRAPVIRAEEAFSRADGLINEIDAIIRARQTETLLEYGPSPLNPANWPAAWEALRLWATTVTEKTGELLESDTRTTAALNGLPAISVLTLIGIVLLFRARHWVGALERIARNYVATAWGWVLETLVSLARIILPLVGGIMLAIAIAISGLLIPETDALLEAVLSTLVALLVTSWLARTIFPEESLTRSFFNIDTTSYPSARRTLLGLGWAFGIYEIVSAVLAVEAENSAGSVTLIFPALVLAAFFTFRFGRIMSRITRADVETASTSESDVNYLDRVFAMVGRGVMGLSLLGVVAGAVGYFVAAEAIIGPLVSSIVLFCLLRIFARLATEVYLALTGQAEAASDSLFPVLVGLLLAIVAIPLFALIWGARVADLTELWATFLTGFTLGDTRISPTNFLTFVAVFLVGYGATRVVQGTLRNSVLPKTRLDTGGRTAIVSGVGYVGIFLAAVLAITTAGIDLSSLAIVAGALSVGIGFGLQTIVSNFVSGIILLIERPVSEGDWIEVGGVMGTVRRISVRATRIETFDRTDVIVPNADLISSHVTNWTKTNLTGRLIVPVGVAYGSDTRRVSAILQEIAENHPLVILNPPPTIVFAGLGASSLDFEIRAILRDINFMLSVKTELLHAVVERFAQEGIEIPFPQQDLWLRNPEGLAQGGQKTDDDPSTVS